MINKSRIVQTGRQYIGTPFVHQGRKPGIGLDCVGLISAIAKNNECYFEDQDCYNIQQWAGDKLLLEMEQNFTPLVNPENACILLIWFRRPHLPQHFAIYTDRDTIIHTEEATGRVVEVQFDERWAKRVHSIWKFKEV